MDDFPVLKAFQQYIDAEQEKARKRIVGLAICFGAFLIVVIAVFMILLHGINARNQALSDRLVEYAMKQNERQSVVTPVVAPRQDDAALKAITDTLVTMQKQLQENKAQAQAPKEEDARTTEAERRIAREKAQLEVERKRLQEEKARLHEIEVDRQRRKLYPELYADEDTTKVRQSPSRVKTRTLTDEDIREIIREAYPESTVAEKHSESKPASSAKATQETTDVDDAIEYFKDDEYTIPVDVGGKSSKVKFTVPVD